MIRVDGRDPAKMRDVRITANPLRHPDGSAMIEVGQTRVLCAATCQDSPRRTARGPAWDGSPPSMPCFPAPRPTACHATA